MELKPNKVYIVIVMTFGVITTVILREIFLKIYPGMGLQSYELILYCVFVIGCLPFYEKAIDHAIILFCFYLTPSFFIIFVMMQMREKGWWEWAPIAMPMILFGFAAGLVIYVFKINPPRTSSSKK